MERLKTAGNGGASRASDQFEIIHLNTALKISRDYEIIVVHNIETTRWKYSQNVLGRRTYLTCVQVHVNWRLKDLTLFSREIEHIMLHRPLRISIKLLKLYMLFNIKKYAFLPHIVFMFRKIMKISSVDYRTTLIGSEFFHILQMKLNLQMVIYSMQCSLNLDVYNFV